MSDKPCSSPNQSTRSAEETPVDKEPQQDCASPAPNGQQPGDSTPACSSRQTGCGSPAAVESQQTRPWKCAANLSWPLIRVKLCIRRKEANKKPSNLSRCLPKLFCAVVQLAIFGLALGATLFMTDYWAKWHDIWKVIGFWLAVYVGVIFAQAKDVASRNYTKPWWSALKEVYSPKHSAEFAHHTVKWLALAIAATLLASFIAPPGTELTATEDTKLTAPSGTDLDMDPGTKLIVPAGTELTVPPGTELTDPSGTKVPVPR